MASLATFTSYGRGAASARVRVFDWLDYLGLEARSFMYVGTSSNSLRSLVRGPQRVLRAEIELRKETRSSENRTVLLSRQASPFSNGSIEAKLLSNASRGVYDFDDALMQAPTRRFDAIWSKRSVWQRSVESASVVIAGNDYLATAASRFNENVVTIPSCIQPSDYVTKVHYGLSEKPCAVWLGSPSTEHYLLGIDKPLLGLHESCGLRISLISAGRASLGELDRMVDRREWSAETYARDLACADFGIMPVDDAPWSRGKCAYKLLQYAATGLPVIGSPVGVNADVLAMSDGFAATSPDEWREALETVVSESSERRARRGRAGRAAVEMSYSFNVWAGAWRDAVGLSNS